MVEQRVEIYLAPCKREGRDGDVYEEVRMRTIIAGIENPVIVGNPMHSEFDYAVERLEDWQARNLVDAINRLEGFCAKAVNWRA